MERVHNRGVMHMKTNVLVLHDKREQSLQGEHAFSIHLEVAIVYVQVEGYQGVDESHKEVNPHR